jgi:hypothetical protein
MSELNDEQAEKLSRELMFYAATQSGFYTDGDSFSLQEEDLMQLRTEYGNYDFTEILDEFCFHVVVQIMELNELRQHQGAKQ